MKPYIEYNDEEGLAEEEIAALSHNPLFEEIYFSSSAVSLYEDPIAQRAKETFGITYLYPWQRLVIANILDAAAVYEKTAETGGEAQDESVLFDEDGVERSHQIILLPTGAGKSLCFLLPALLLNGVTLILYPLLALLSDQERRMKEAGIESAVLRGQQSVEERQKNFQKLDNGAKIILANPEVLQSDELRKKLHKYAIIHIAIDEAHCVSEWGDSFRPAYLTIGTLIADLHIPLVSAFTATASPEVLSRVAEVLFNGRAHIVRGESDRQNIRYYVQYAAAKEQAVLREVMAGERPMIIFCSTRKRAEQMARFLRSFLPDGNMQEDIPVRFYHAGLQKEEKAVIEKWFYGKKDAILTATCAFGMGVDKKDIRTVIHLDPPATAEAYIQEAGRAGRDGSVAKAILIWSPEDSHKAKEFQVNSRKHVLADFAESGICRRAVLLKALGAEETACAGCDICEAKEHRKTIQSTAKDAALVRQFMCSKSNGKKYSHEQAMDIVRIEANKASLVKYGKKIWDIGSIKKLFIEYTG